MTSISPVTTTSKGPKASSKPDARALKPDGRTEGHIDDAMEVEQPLICIPIIATLAELCEYSSDDNFSEGAPSRYPTPSTPPPQADTKETNPSTVRRIGRPTIEEQQRSDKAYAESEPLRTSPPRPLKRQARIYYAATSSSAIKKPSEEKHREPVNFELREKKRALTVDSDDEDLNRTSSKASTSVVDPPDAHRNKRMRFEPEEPKTRRTLRGRKKNL